MTRAIVSHNATLGGWTVIVPEVVEGKLSPTTRGTVWATAGEALEVALEHYGSVTLDTKASDSNSGTIGSNRAIP